MMIITEALQLTDEKPAVLQIKNTQRSQVIAIGLKKDQVLKKHISSIPALLVVLKGSVIFDMNGEKTSLPTYSTFEIPVNVSHEVTGVEESIFLVIKEKL
jgi:quercetin dioxygenase-like cupin family protein